MRVQQMMLAMASMFVCVQGIALDSDRKLTQMSAYDTYEDSSESELSSIVELAVATPALSTLAFVLTQPAYAGVLEALSGPGPFTVFAPTDAAFAATFASTGIDPSNVAAITSILQYHVLAGAVPSSALGASQSVATLQGETMLVTKSSAGVMINGNAKVVIADVMASNGVVHVADSVLLPPSMMAPAAPVACSTGLFPTLKEAKADATACGCDPAGAHDMGGGQGFMVSHDCQDAFNAAKAAPAPAAKAAVTQKSIVELAVGTPALSTLAFVLQQPAYAGVLEALSGPGPFTVFAPTDTAFAAAFANSGIDPSNVAVITSVLKYHVVAGAVPSSALKASQSVATLQGESMLVTKTAAGVMVNGKAKVVAADVTASNGVVHVIDAVLLPPSLMAPAPAAKACSTGLFPTLKEAKADATACGCDPAGAHDMGGGQGFMVSHDCQDAFNAAKAAPAPAAKAAVTQKSIVELAVGTPALSTLAFVLQQPAYAGVLEALSGPGPFTVFAPTDTAFAAAFANTGIDPSNVAVITSVLKYHVVAGAVPSSALRASQSVATLQGEAVKITKTAAGVMVNGKAKVVAADVMASNGVVHVIDAVLLPPSLMAPAPAPAMAPAPASAAGPKSIVELAVATPELSTLVTVLTSPAYAPVLEALSSPGPFTVFAPTDAAFAKAGVDINDVATVTAVLQYHVLAGSAPTSKLGPAQSAQTLQGESVLIMMNEEGVKVNGNAKVVIADVMASNGVVHVVDSVLKPPSFMTIVDLTLATPSLSTLKTVLTLPEYAGVLEALSGPGPFTVFAPTDAAFAKAGVDVYDVETVTAVLKYHVLSGAVESSALAPSQSVPTLQGEALRITKTQAGVTVNGKAKVLLADVKAFNGIIHVVDTVLVPPSILASAKKAAPAPAPAVQAPPKKSILDVAMETPALSTLVSVVSSPAYAAVLTALSGAGPFTVFTPTNEAFADAGIDVNDVAAVTAVLKYHVLAGAVPSSALARQQAVPTLQGEDVYVTKTQQGVFVNGEKVIVADVMTSNGVVHVIDTVLMPPSMMAAPAAPAAPQARAPVAPAAPRPQQQQFQQQQFQQQQFQQQQQQQFYQRPQQQFYQQPQQQQPRFAARASASVNVQAPQGGMQANQRFNYAMDPMRG
jgi:transforming growth factor-beta-induced protein